MKTLLHTNNTLFRINPQLMSWYLGKMLRSSFPVRKDGLKYGINPVLVAVAVTQTDLRNYSKNIWLKTDSIIVMF